MGILNEHLTQCVNLTRYFDTRRNATERMFNKVTGGWDYSRWEHNTNARFPVAVERSTEVILEKIYNEYWLLRVGYATRLNARGMK
jgi:hypothetical protein